MVAKRKTKRKTAKTSRFLIQYDNRRDGFIVEKIPSSFRIDKAKAKKEKISVVRSTTRREALRKFSARSFKGETGRRLR